MPRQIRALFVYIERGRGPVRLEFRRDALDALHDAQEISAREARELEAVPAALVHLRNLGETQTISRGSGREEKGVAHESGVFGDILEAFRRTLDAVVITSEADAIGM